MGSELRSEPSQIRNKEVTSAVTTSPGQYGGYSTENSQEPRRPLLIRQQKLQVLQREALGELGFSEDILRQSLFLFLQFADFFLDAVFDEQPVGHDFVDLPNSMRPINGLVLDGWVPPRIKED